MAISLKNRNQGNPRKDPSPTASLKSTEQNADFTCQLQPWCLRPKGPVSLCPVQAPCDHTGPELRFFPDHLCFTNAMMMKRAPENRVRMSLVLALPLRPKMAEVSEVNSSKPTQELPRTREGQRRREGVTPSLHQACTSSGRRHHGLVVR